MKGDWERWCGQSPPSHPEETEPEWEKVLSR